MKKPIYIMIHHSAVSVLANPDQFNANNRYHKKLWSFRSSLGFCLGYNYEINEVGYVYKARVPGERTAACYQKQMNDGRCVHICLDGNFEIENPAPNQIYALRDLLREIAFKFMIPAENIVFHKDYSNTLCPGINMDLKFIRTLINDRPK